VSEERWVRSRYGCDLQIFFVRDITFPPLAMPVLPACRRLNGTRLGKPRAPAQSRPHVRIYDKLYSGRRVALVTVVIQGARPSVITAVTGLRSLAWPQAQASLTIMFKQRFAQRLPTRAL
jgi:hypothetical protein